MKIHQLLSGISLPVSNEEQTFIESHRGDIKITSLNERDTIIAQTLVRKGIYEISSNNLTLIKKIK